MATFVYSKEDFIKWIDKEVSDKQVIVFTNEVTGNLSISKKTGLKISHVFADTVFKDVGVGHIAFGETHPLGLMIADKKRLSDTSKKILNKTT